MFTITLNIFTLFWVILKLGILAAFASSTYLMFHYPFEFSVRRPGSWIWTLLCLVLAALLFGVVRIHPVI
jgi:hypothetical protein